MKLSITLILSFLFLFLFDRGYHLSLAKEDEVVEEEGSVDIEHDGTRESPEVPDQPEAVLVKDTGSSNAELFLLFTKPTFLSHTNLELPAGKTVEFLVGFTNKGSIEFTLDYLEASLRYPMDFNYVIQNFTTSVYNRGVSPGHQATLAYAFTPADSFAGRPFGLSINLAYKDEFGIAFVEKVYNETIHIVEVEEGLDGETFFLYVFLGAGVVLMLVIGQQFLYSMGKKRVVGSSKKPAAQIETGTKKKKNDIDLDWVPKQVLKNYNKSPKVTKSAPQSPRTRRTKRTAGFDD